MKTLGNYLRGVIAALLFPFIAAFRPGDFRQFITDAAEMGRLREKMRLLSGHMPANYKHWIGVKSKRVEDQS